MLTEYIAAAMKRAQYKIIEDDGTFFGEIPGFPGVWSNADTLEQCRTQLQEVLEGWLVLKLRDRDDDLPVIDGLNILPQPSPS
jgi:predicted RNase H-like HicB family nuclease